MSTHVFPVGRVVSSDSLVGADTAVGDLLVDAGAGAVSLRAQDPTTGAPVDVVLAPQGGGGGVNPGTPGTIPKYNLAGTNVVDSQVREGPKSVAIGPAAGALLLHDWTAGSSSLTWRDSALRVPVTVTEAGQINLGVNPSLGAFSEFRFAWAGASQRIDVTIAGGNSLAVLSDGIESGNINDCQLSWRYNSFLFKLLNPALGPVFTVNCSTLDVTVRALAGNPSNHAIVASAGGVLGRANGQTFYPYTANGVDWANPKPDNVHAALDRIATALAGLLGGPIP